MQERDLKVLEFLTMCRICTRKQVQELLFPNVHENIPLRRLKKLNDEGYIKRKMFNVEGTKNMYVYFLDKQPKKKLITHDLYITDFLVKLINNGCEILEFKKSPKIGNIIPDAYIKIKKEKSKICDGTLRYVIYFSVLFLYNKIRYEYDCKNHKFRKKTGKYQKNRRYGK